MKPTRASFGIDRRAILSSLAAIPGLASLRSAPARAQSASADKGFSFVAVGDTRPMMYLPQKEGQPDLVRLFVEMFGLAMPENAAEELVKKDVKLTFDSDLAHASLLPVPWTPG
jgi:hypothetical protein